MLKGGRQGGGIWSEGGNSKEHTMALYGSLKQCSKDPCRTVQEDMHKVSQPMIVIIFILL